jgi:hypothetical protein
VINQNSYKTLVEANQRKSSRVTSLSYTPSPPPSSQSPGNRTINLFDGHPAHFAVQPTDHSPQFQLDLDFLRNLQKSCFDFEISSVRGAFMNDAVSASLRCFETVIWIPTTLSSSVFLVNAHKKNHINDFAIEF